MAEKKEQKRVPGYKSENQKYKSLLVMQYILKNAADEHAVTIGQIEDHLAKYAIEAKCAPFCIQKTKNPGCMSLRFSSK